MGFYGNPLPRRALLTGACATVLLGSGRRADAQGAARPADGPHRIVIDVPILADDPVAIPLSISMDHPMEPDHYIRSFEVVLPSDPVPSKGKFRFTPLAGRAAVAYQFRSGQGGDLAVTAECSRHGRFEARQSVRVAPGGCAVPPGPGIREQGGNPSVRVNGRARPGELAAVWAALRHTSHTGLAEAKGQFVQERAPYFVERLATFRGSEPVNEFTLTSAVSPDPRLRFFVRVAAGHDVRVEFVNNRGQKWEASHRLS